MSRSFLFLTLFGASCDNETIGYPGYDMPDHFPLDGKRAWEYASEQYDFKLDVEMSETAVPTGDGTEIRTFEYYHDPNGDLLMSIRWSSDPVVGIRIWGYEVYDLSDGGEDSGGAGADSGGVALPDWAAESYTFDPPILLSDRQEKPGDVQVTSTGGFEFQATFSAVEKCENLWVGGENTWDCLRIDLVESGGASLRILGSYWMAPRYGLSWFQLNGETTPWVLTKADWEAE